MKFFNLIYFIFLSALVAFTVYLYFNIEDLEIKVKENIKSVILKNTSYFSDNVLSILPKNCIKENDLHRILQENASLRKELEEKMQMLVTPSFKYVYMLYKDNNGNYRYLLDGSKSDKGFFDSKFNVNTKEWDKVYTTKQTNIVFQDNLDGLWITLLQPYITNGEVQGIVAMDFATSILKDFSRVVAPLKSVFFYVFIAIIFLFSVITYQIILQLRTKKEAITDPLTQAYNRVYLRNFLEKINFNHYDLAMFDLDYFKKVNDNYGHKAGDMVLQSFATIVQNNIRNKDVFVRFGGEEFMLFIYKGKKYTHQSEAVVERIRKAVEESQLFYDGIMIKVTVSIGLVTDIHKYKNIQEAIKQADENLYEAKHKGRNLVVSCQSQKKPEQNNSLRIGEVKFALDEGRVFCHFQPIVDLKNNTIVKYEALVRLRDTEGRVVYPNAFLEVIERTNIYRDLTKNVLEIVFAMIARQKVNISMNLNLSDIIDNAIYTMLLKELQSHKDLSKYLTIELLEYEAVVDEILIKRLHDIKSYGVTIALDDFGTGYSNFSIFENFPIDIIKIDGSLIKEIDSSKTSLVVVQSIMSLADGLGMEVIAEFVHNEAVLMKLKELKIKFGQGFHLGKPQEKIG